MIIKKHILSIAGLVAVFCAILTNANADERAGVVGGSVTELWSRIDFTTEGGDRVSIDASSDSIRSVTLTLDNHQIKLPQRALQGLPAPVLSRTTLWVSAEIADGKTKRGASLEFPIWSDDRESLDDFDLVHFVFINGQLKARCIWSNKARNDLVDALDFSNSFSEPVQWDKSNPQKPRWCL